MFRVMMSDPARAQAFLRDRERLQGLIGILFWMLATVMLLARINSEGGILP